MRLAKLGAVVVAVALVPWFAGAAEPGQDASAKSCGMCSKAKPAACPAGAADKKACCADMVEQLKAADARLQQKLDAVKAASGDQKVQSQQDVIDELLAQNKMLRDQMDQCMSSGHCKGEGKTACKASSSQPAQASGGCPFMAAQKKAGAEGSDSHAAK